MIKTEKYIEYLFSATLKKYGSIPDANHKLYDILVIQISAMPTVQVIHTQSASVLHSKKGRRFRS